MFMRQNMETLDCHPHPGFFQLWPPDKVYMSNHEIKRYTVILGLSALRNGHQTKFTCQNIQIARLTSWVCLGFPAVPSRHQRMFMRQHMSTGD